MKEKTIQVNLLPLDTVIDKFEYHKNHGKAVWTSRKCKIGINFKMEHLFGKPIKVTERNYYSYSYNDETDHWSISIDWVDKDIFKIREIDMEFEDIL